MFGKNHFPLCRQTLHGFQRRWQRGEYCNGSSVFSDLKGLSSRYTAKVNAQILLQFSYPDSRYLLCHVADGSTISSGNNIREQRRVFAEVMPDKTRSSAIRIWTSQYKDYVAAAPSATELCIDGQPTLSHVMDLMKQRNRGGDTLQERS